MREHILYLTKKAGNPYAGSGTKSMATTPTNPTPKGAVPQPKQPEKEPSSTGAKKVEENPRPTPQRIQEALKRYEKYERAYLKQEGKKRVEDLSPEERQVLALYKKMAEEQGRFFAFKTLNQDDDKINNTNYTKRELQNIIDEINQRADQLGTERIGKDYLDKQIARVQALIDLHPFDNTLVGEGLQLISVLEQRADQVPVEEVPDEGEPTEEEYDGTRAGLARKLENTPLTLGEASTTDGPTFNPTRFQRNIDIANRVQAALEAGNQANNAFFRNTIRELVERMQELQETRNDPDAKAQIEEAGRLIHSLQNLKDALGAKIADLRGDSLQNIYGEIRQSEEQIADNVQNAIDSVVKRDAQGRETEESRLASERLEKAFNKLFTRVGINTSEEWKDAVGSAGSIEFDLFFMGLGNAAAGRTMPLKRQLTLKERHAIEQKTLDLKESSKLREHLHNLSYYINRNANIEEMSGIMNRFPMDYLDKAYRMRGVAQIDHFFEQAMFQVMTRNGWYLPYEAMVTQADGTPGEVDKMVYDQAMKAQQKGILPSDMEPWEIERAISLARGLRVATGRALEVVAQGGIPKDTPLVSWWANNIIKKMAFFKQIARYNVGFERNRILAYKLEEGSLAWSTQELAKMKTGDILDRFTKETNEDRLMDMTNPMRIGSVYTQTGWRYGKDEITHAGVISKLLDGYTLNPIIGAGMWIEKERRNLVPTERNHKFHENPSYEEVMAELRDAFPNEEIPEIRTKGERALFIIRKNLELSAQIAPLKLFYNMMGLRQDVLHVLRADAAYDGEITEPGKGQIKIAPEGNLYKDLRLLTLAQEKLLRQRVGAYKQWAGGDRVRANRPDLYREHTDLDATIREIADTPEQAARMLRLVGHIRTTFNEQNAGPSYKNKLLGNLLDKGWKVPYIFGTDDLPNDLYDFVATGGSSLQRRWGDIASAEKGADKLEQLIMNMTMFRSQDDLIKAMNDVYQVLRGHDEGVASEVMFRIAEGVTKFYKKDWASRLPFGMGLWRGFVGGKTSFAQLIYGREQMSWDEFDVDEFIKRLHASGLLGEHEIAEERLAQLRKRTGSEWWNLFLIAMPRTGISLGLIGFIYYMLIKTLPEEITKGK